MNGTGTQAVPQSVPLASPLSQRPDPTLFHPIGYLGCLSGNSVFSSSGEMFWGKKNAEMKRLPLKKHLLCAKALV